MAGIGQNLSMQTAMRQSMALTPQMIQSMELLQLPLLDLEQRINEEVMLNPALELGEMQAEARAAETDDAPAPETPAEYGSDLDCDWENVYERDNFSPSGARGGDDDDEHFDALSVVAGRQVSLDEHLLRQLGLLRLDDRLKTMCGEIVYALDRDGYFREDLEKIGAALVPPPDEQERGWALDAVQSLQPAGVAATSPGECLALQLKALTPETPEELAVNTAARAIVTRHLEDLAANRLPKIASAIREPLETVKEAVRLIQTLDPYPGRSYDAPKEKAVRPDVFVELEPAGARDREKAVEFSSRAHEKFRRLQVAFAAGQAEENEVREAELDALDAKTAYELFEDDGSRWVVRPAGGIQPEVSEIFLALFDNTGRGKALRERWERDPEKKAELEQVRAAIRANGQTEEMRKKYFDAGSIVRAVRQREITVLRITREIVAAQKDYLAGRAPVPAPLMMKDVAAKLEMDTGTVSRAVADKYADTPLGLRPLREFFIRPTASLSAPAENAGSGAPAPEEIGNVLIQKRIKELIDAEDKRKPLKDDVIQDLLAKEGIKIARRTVAKHRGLLGFPNYSQRREY